MAARNVTVNPSLAATSLSPGFHLLGDQHHFLGMTPAELRGRRQHVVRPTVNVHVVGRLDLPGVDAECLVIEVEHRYAVPLKGCRQLILAPGRNLEGQAARDRIPARLKLRVHPPREVRDDRIRVLLLGAGDADLVLFRRLARRRHNVILQHDPLPVHRAAHLPM